MARKDAGHRDGQVHERVERFPEVVKKASRLPVAVQMTPNHTDMIPVALAVKRGGADGIAAINTIRAITEIDLEPLLAAISVLSVDVSAHSYILGAGTFAVWSSVFLKEPG